MTDAVHDEAPENVDPTIVGVPNYDKIQLRWVKGLLADRTCEAETLFMSPIPDLSGNDKRNLDRCFECS